MSRLTKISRLRDVGELEWEPDGSSGEVLLIYPSGLVQLRSDVGPIGDEVAYRPIMEPTKVRVEFSREEG